MGHAPGWKVVCVGRHGDKGMRMDGEGGGEGWGKREIKCTQLDTQTRLQKGALSLEHSPARESRARGGT